MERVEIEVSFVPPRLRAFARNEAQISIVLKSLDNERTYWSECDVVLASPLSLSHDSELNMARTRVGILKPMGRANKQIKFYTRPNNYPDDYTLGIVAYLYDEDGAIAERIEKKFAVQCVAEEGAIPEKDGNSLAPADR